jgi:hypothetical protein
VYRKNLKKNAPHNFMVLTEFANNLLFKCRLKYGTYEGHIAIYILHPDLQGVDWIHEIIIIIHKILH